MKALYHHGRKDLPFGTDLNIFSGCSHGCIYCYARARYAERRGCHFSDFEKSTFRAGIAESLDRELYAIRQKGAAIPLINIGGSCDSYQPKEKISAAMRDILEVMIEHRAPVIFSTKSAHVVRDIDLIDRLASAAGVCVAVTITSSSAEISGRIEPGAPAPDERARALKELSKTGAFTGLHYFPVIPFLGDTEETVSAITEMAADSGCDYIMPGFLYLRGGIKEMFLSEIAVRFPGLEERYRKLYAKGSAEPSYKKGFYSVFYSHTGKKRLCTDYRKFLPRQPEESTRAGSGKQAGQLTLPF